MKRPTPSDSQTGFELDGQDFPVELWCEATHAWEEVRKADDGTEKKVMRIGGIASTEELDRQGETVIQEGLNFAPFLKHGWFNDDHKAGTVLGWPTDAKLVQKGDQLPSGRTADKKGWWVAGEVIDTPRGREVYETACALERQDAPRRLGYSIEGKVVSQHGGSILQAHVNEVAITKKPVNTGTHLEILAKALEAGTVLPSDDEAGSGAALQPESLETKRKRRTKKMANGTSALPDWLREIDTMSPQARKATMKAMRAYMKAMDYDDDDAGDDDDDDDDMEKKKKAKKAAKSFAVDDSVVSDLRKSIETLTDEVSDLRKSEYDWDWDDAAEYFDTDELNEAEALDATGLIKSFTGASVQGFRQVQGMIATQQKQIELQGKLIKSMAEANLKLLEGFNKQANADAEIRKSIAELAGSPAVQRGVTDPRQMAVMARMFAKSAASGSAAATQANPFAGALPAPAQDGQGGQQVVSMVALTHETRGLAKSLRDSLMKKGMEAHDAGDGEGFQAAQAAMVQLERAVNRGQIFLHPDHQRRFDLSLVPSN